MRRSESLTELTKALIAAKGEMGPLIANSENPMFHSKYADLAAVTALITAPLAKHGLAVIQEVSVENVISVVTLLTHTSGEWLETVAHAPAIEGNRGTNAVQAAATGITYLRRYSLVAIIGLATEDTDGNGHNGNGNGKPAAQPVAQAPAPKPAPKAPAPAAPSAQPAGRGQQAYAKLFTLMDKYAVSDDERLAWAEKARAARMKRDADALEALVQDFIKMMAAMAAPKAPTAAKPAQPIKPPVESSPEDAFTDDIPWEGGVPDVAKAQQSDEQAEAKQQEIF